MHGDRLGRIGRDDMKNWLAELKRMSPSEIRLGLDRIERLLKELGDPQKQYPSVIVAGTNGKGSVTAMIASMLSAAGYRVGWYTSPHLVDVRERIRIGGAMIQKTSLEECASIIRSHQKERLTYFEFLTAVAFLYFSRESVDLAVLEVGLGGRLDATNVVHPLVSVITNISLEHRDFLGDTLEKIAAEKGGVIKKGGLCITGATQSPVLTVLEGICRARKARLLKLGRDLKIRIGSDALFSFQGISGGRYPDLRCPLRGRHQYANAALALGVMEQLARLGYPVSDFLLRIGLEETRWEGRMELLQQNPAILVDGAHNPDGMSVLCRALRHEFSYRRLHVVLGIMADKDLQGMIGKIASVADAVILTRPSNERAAAPDQLLPYVNKYHRNVAIERYPVRAVKLALKTAQKNDLICITGSLYLVGDIKRALRNGRLP